jgi:hypothetical protein
VKGICHLEDVDVSEDIIKNVFNKEDVRMWIALFWYRQAEMLLVHQEGLLTLLPKVSLLSDE